MLHQFTFPSSDYLLILRTFYWWLLMPGWALLYVISPTFYCSVFLRSSDGFVPRSMFGHKDKRAAAVRIPRPQYEVLEVTRATVALSFIKAAIFKVYFLWFVDYVADYVFVILSFCSALCNCFKCFTNKNCSRQRFSSDCNNLTIAGWLSVRGSEIYFQERNLLLDALLLFSRKPDW